MRVERESCKPPPNHLSSWPRTVVGTEHLGDGGGPVHPFSPSSWSPQPSAKRWLYLFLTLSPSLSLQAHGTSTLWFCQQVFLSLRLPSFMMRSDFSLYLRCPAEYMPVVCIVYVYCAESFPSFAVISGIEISHRSIARESAVSPLPTSPSTWCWGDPTGPQSRGSRSTADTAIATQRVSDAGTRALRGKV